MSEKLKSSSWITQNRLSSALETLAFVILLACITGRCFISETPVRTSALGKAAAQLAQPQAQEDLLQAGEYNELARTTLAVGLLMAVGVWLLAGAIKGHIPIRHGWFVMLVIIFAILSALSAYGASDKRSAITSWFEQASILIAAVMAVQLFREKKKFNLFLAILVGIGGALAAKGLYQVFVEVGDRIGDFEIYRDERLAQLGFADDSPSARAYEARLRSKSALGFINLSNIFGSLLIVLFLTSAGLALGKLTEAIKRFKTDKATLKQGEIHLPTLAAIITLIIPALIGVVLVFTNSRGAILAGIFASIVTVAVYFWRKQLSRHWRKAVIITIVIFLLGLAAVVGYGLEKDRLPTKTMTFRWYYWTGAGEIFRDNIVHGVGGGNFGSHYLQYRRPEAEESVKTPHNTIVYSACQFGLAGGLCYLGLVGYVLVGMCKPEKNQQSLEQPNKQDSSQKTIWLIMLLCLVALAARLAFGGVPRDPNVIIFEAILPAAVLGAMLLAALWTGRKLSIQHDCSRLALACGLGGFFLHNMVSYSLWIPATATVFWIAAGACLAQSDTSRERKITFARWPVAIVTAILIVCSIAIFWRPSYRKTRFQNTALEQFRKNTPIGALAFAHAAAILDKFDALTAADAAKVSIANLPFVPKKQQLELLNGAAKCAEKAIERDLENYSHWKLAADIEVFKSLNNKPSTKALQLMARAIGLNPQNSRLRIDYAKMLLNSGENKKSLNELEQAIKIEQSLLPESFYRFSEKELAEIKELQRLAQSSL